MNKTFKGILEVMELMLATESVDTPLIMFNDEMRSMYWLQNKKIEKLKDVFERVNLNPKTKLFLWRP